MFVRTADPHHETATTGKLLVDAWQGLVYTLRNPTLRALGVSLSVLNLGWGIVTIVLPVLLIRELGYGEAIVGIAFAVSGVTGGIGALAAGRWRLQGRERPLLVWPMLLTGRRRGGDADLADAPGRDPGAMAFQGLLNGPMDVALFTLRQRRTDPAWMGRAFAVSMSLNFLGYPIGAAIGGTLVASGTDVALAVDRRVHASSPACSAASAPASLVAAGLRGRRGPRGAHRPVRSSGPIPTPADPDARLTLVSAARSTRTPRPAADHPADLHHADAGRSARRRGGRSRRRVIEPPRAPVRSRSTVSSRNGCGSSR